MLTVKKQLTALGLVILVGMPLSVSVFLFVSQQLIRHQHIQRFKTELQETITIKADKLKWIEYGEEIEIDGNLFDVEHFKTTGTNTVLTGFFDYKEETLVKHLDEIEQQKNKSGSPLSRMAIKFLFLPNYKELIGFSIQNNWLHVSKELPLYTESVCTMVYPAVSPPPKYV